MKRMRACRFWTCLAAVFLSIWFLGGRSAEQVGWRCTKCLEGHSVNYSKLLAISYWKTKQEERPRSEYVEITGHKCEHLYKKGGMGRQTKSIFGEVWKDYKFAEGVHFSKRNRLIADTFGLHDQWGDKELARRTLSLIDELVPPDYDWRSRDSLTDSQRYRFMLLRLHFEEISSLGDWHEILDAADAGKLEAHNKTEMPIASQRL